MTSGGITADGRIRVLADGNQMPMLGLGVFQVPNGAACVNAVRWALDLGYRHIDTAQIYGNEESVGRALRDSGIPRHEVFLTTKFHPGRKAQLRRPDPVAAAEQSLRRLGVDQVDLYLVHRPGGRGRPTWAWPRMERARELGLARSIGVSNFSASQLERVIAAGTIPPAVNQVQFSHLIWGWSRGVKMRAGAGRGGLGLLPRPARGWCRCAGRGTVGRAARDAGALWNANP
jgi:diketogulonate reductase-like aldo/keto reductase